MKSPTIAALFTVIDIALEVVVFPAPSVATVVIVCEPFETPVVFHVPEYVEPDVGVVKKPPLMGEPSKLNCTEAIPEVVWPLTTGSEALAAIETEEPETVLPFEGELMLIVGAVISGDGVGVGVGVGVAEIAPQG